jgi:hypothetical protein
VRVGKTLRTMPKKKASKPKAKAKPKREKPSARRSPAAAVLAKGAFRPRVVKSKRAYSRKAKPKSTDDS